MILDTLALFAGNVHFMILGYFIGVIIEHIMARQ